MKRALGFHLFLFPAVLLAQGGLPSNYFLTRLDNGLEVLVVEDRNVPLATLELCVKNGSYTESPEFNGLSHLYEHMFFKANRDYASQEAFMERIREMGAVFNGTTSEERVNYFITVTNKNLEAGLNFLNVAMRYPKFDPDEMKRENPVVNGEFERAESDPVFFLLDDMARHLWGKHYSRKNTIGDHHIINTATPEKMRIIKAKYYHPNNTLLAVAGDVDHNEVFRLAQKIYGSWERADFDPHLKYPVPEFEKLPWSSQFVTLNENATVPIVLMSWHGPDTRNDILSTYAADVFSYVLSQQSSRLNQEMVESGLVQQISVSYQTLSHTGPIQIFMVLQDPSKLEEAMKKLYEHIAMWDSEDYFTDGQLSTAKDLLAIGEAYNSERTSDFIHTLTYWWASADIDYYVNYVSNLRKVTRENIREYVRKYIIGKPFVAGLLIHPEQAQQFGTAAFFTDTRSPEEARFTFDWNSAGLNSSSRETVTALAQWLKINPDESIRISAYREPGELAKIKLMESDITHYPGKEKLKGKQPLADARYLSVAGALCAEGIDISRISPEVTFQTRKK